MLAGCRARLTFHLISAPPPLRGAALRRRNGQTRVQPALPFPAKRISRSRKILQSMGDQPGQDRQAWKML
jgi:hypothetical protein